MRVLLQLFAITFTRSVVAAPPDITISLPYGIQVTIPSGWRASREDVSAMLSAARGTKVNATAIREDSTGHLVLFAAPLERSDEASVEFSIQPTGVSQAVVGRLSEREIADADVRFRKEIEGAIRRSGLTLLEWRGTTRASLGGRVALVRRYRFHYPDKPPMLMESYGIYLGNRAIQIRIQYSERSSPPTAHDIDLIRKSIELSVAAL
jgi:hypothetical protein